jgi:predicted nucleotide-binding protein
VELPAIVLHEQANKGGTILEKFERHAQSASLAVVLLTGDDEGRLRDSDKPLSPRGRQNVILELGVFIGLLGRERVVVLKDPGVEEPSDLTGLMYIPLDDAGPWRTDLLRELAASGIKVDHSRIP